MNSFGLMVETQRPCLLLVREGEKRPGGVGARRPRREAAGRGGRTGWWGRRLPSLGERAAAKWS